MECYICDNTIKETEFEITNCCKENVHKYCLKQCKYYLWNCIICKTNYGKSFKIKMSLDNFFTINTKIDLFKHIYKKINRCLHSDGIKFGSTYTVYIPKYGDYDTSTDCARYELDNYVAKINEKSKTIRPQPTDFTWIRNMMNSMNNTNIMDTDGHLRKLEWTDLD
jgi:hypothetical protein